MKHRLLYILALLFATLHTFAQTYTYDKLNRLTEVVYENGTTVTYTYDALGNRTSKNVTGSVASKEAYAWLSADGKTLTFCYDNKRSERTGETYNLNTEENNPAWNPEPSYNNPSSVTKVVFESSFADARPTSTYSWFNEFTKLSSITGLEYLNTSEVITMSRMFADCDMLESIDLSHFDTSKVGSMYAMFWSSGVKSLDVSRFDTSNVTDMGFMFCLCGGLKSLNVSNFNTSNVTNMENMFSSLGVEHLDLSNFNTSNVTNMYFMFANNYYLKDIDVSSFNTSNVENFYCMFYQCTSLKVLNVSNFDVSPSSSWYFYVDELFSKCTSLQCLYVSPSMSGLASSACNGVGTEEHPCYIVAPEGFDFGVDTSAGTFAWKGGYFKLGGIGPSLAGDVNGDGAVDVADIATIIDIMAGVGADPISALTADVNGDGTVDVADIASVISIMAGGSITPVDDRQLIVSTVVDGIEYAVYIKQDKDDVRYNADHSPYYRTTITLDVTKNGKTTTYPVDDSPYIGGDYNSQIRSMCINKVTKQIFIFANSSLGYSYALDGYCYVASLNDLSFQRETVFSTSNFGWWPYFSYESGVLRLNHFSFAGYYAMISTRNSDGTWTTERGGYIRPDDFAAQSEQAGRVLIVDGSNE